MFNWNNIGIQVDGRRVFTVTRATGLTVVRNQNETQRTNYEDSVRAALNNINSRTTGAILLDEIRAALQSNSRVINVVPFDSRDNAASGGNRVNSTPFGEQVRDERGRPRVHNGDNPATPAVEHAGDPVLGSGAGISPTLLFDPQTFSPHLSSTAGFTANEVLFHELIHSKRQVQARTRNLPAGANYDNAEEFAAVVVTNIYASEGGATWLRGNHRLPVRGSIVEPATILDYDARAIFGQMAPAPQTTESQRFAQRFHRELNQFAQQDAQFCRRLAQVRAHFNPIRDHMISIGAVSRG